MRGRQGTRRRARRRGLARRRQRIRRRWRGPGTDVAKSFGGGRHPQARPDDRRDHRDGLHELGRDRRPRRRVRRLHGRAVAAGRQRSRRQPRRVHGVRELRQLRERRRLLARPRHRGADAPGLLSGHAAPGLACGAANLFSSSRGLVVSADGSALYVAAPLEGAVSTLNSSASLRTPGGIVPAASVAPPASGSGTQASSSGPTTTPATSTSTADAAAPAPDGSAPRPLSSIFSTSLAGDELLNPCIAVNGLDGACAVGTATGGLDGARAEPGRQAALWRGARQPRDRRVRARRQRRTGADRLREGSAPTRTVQHREPADDERARPLAREPGRQNVYATATIAALTRVSVGRVRRERRRRGRLASGSCVDFAAPAPNRRKPTKKAKKREEHVPPPRTALRERRRPERAPSVVAVSGDGSSVYAIGSGSAAIFARETKTGKLTETSCASRRRQPLHEPAARCRVSARRRQPGWTRGLRGGRQKRCGDGVRHRRIGRDHRASASRAGRRRCACSARRPAPHVQRSRRRSRGRRRARPRAAAIARTSAGSTSDGPGASRSQPGRQASVSRCD